MSHVVKSPFFIFRGASLLLTNTLTVPTKEHPFVNKSSFERQVEFNQAEILCTAAELKRDVDIPENMHLRKLMDLYLCLPHAITSPAGKARQLLEWDKSHQFCGVCGSRTTHSDVEEHCKICLQEFCSRKFYPQISPVVIVAAERGNEILLARSPSFPPEIYTTIAGFVEPGETLEEAAAREVWEEVGIKIQNIRYFGSQSWPFDSQLTIGFKAEYESGDIIREGREIEDAAFFTAGKLPPTFPGRGVTISQQLIEDFNNRFLV